MAQSESGNNLMDHSNETETKWKISDKGIVLKETPEPWIPKVLDIDPLREKVLLDEMERCIIETEKSEFYRKLKEQLQSPLISKHMRRVLGSESKMQVIIYGIGNIEWHEKRNRMQLSLPILMKKDFTWIGDIEIFDPILQTIECRVMKALGCSVCSFNEHGRREALKPTLFFMPFCQRTLIDNLLQTNWKISLLKNIVLLGNSFKRNIDISVRHLKLVSGDDQKIKKSDLGYIWVAKKFANEFPIRTRFDDYGLPGYDELPGRNSFHPFKGLSWHFFSNATETKLSLDEGYLDVKKYLFKHI
ncbi:protein SENSITIVITY TO RED LIGHT REDUCED 1-like [Prosopis cineraria]|uniref:protein SENSITIVITY TO RED LIGHT REDUCED 1-like n=1 Tax=Prosopis cineraria TaxID=364024 RepID=UPI00241067CE|nr:protein SENSITIVITY TO RED LIGHT REDUCED 1-like [Prosopis cineraria]